MWEGVAQVAVGGVELAAAAITWSWQVASMREAIMEVAMPQKTEIPISCLLRIVL